VSVGSDPSETKVPRSSPAPIAGAKFEAFYRTRWLPTVRLARMILGSTEEAEELSQEALIRVHERWGSLERPDSFLYIVTVNLCRSQVRRRGVERRKAVVDPLSVVREPEVDETWLALMRLPFRQRAVLALRYYADLPEAEIARRTSPQALRQQISRRGCNGVRDRRRPPGRRG
jgi:RNA polymerase sigma factor (sigma-70 family)